MKIGYADYILRLERCPKDDVGGSNNFGKDQIWITWLVATRLVGFWVWEKKNDKGWLTRPDLRTRLNRLGPDSARVLIEIQLVRSPSSHLGNFILMCGSPSSHRGKSTLMCRYDKPVTCSSFSGGFFMRSKLSPCCDLLGLSDRPNLNSVKRARSLSSICVSKVSNLAPIRSTNDMA
ncbi:hypothetical protein B296_00015188 [Ensete ventricosum]|uniref:Uncharacterized protein n=1 Tax=Ensete ventricosum TaxID=4639 RepID=A0A426ZLX9_ENSVE|nr:hypothetical protein B296_00015188 [Ensete ventricosum]